MNAIVKPPGSNPPAANPSAAILIIGNEILSGRTQDVNINFIARRLASLGIELREARVIPDIPKRIVDAVNELRAAYTHVFTTGGIGPTHDDITSECIAEAFGVPWEPHQETWARMERLLPPGQFNAARQRMATMPRGAVPIPNPISFAPGFSMGNVHVMAGVPRIMQAMFHDLEPRLGRGTPIEMRAVHGIGLREGSIAIPLGDIAKYFGDVDIGSYPFYRENTGGVAIVAKGRDVARLDEAIAAIGALIQTQGITPVPGEPA